MPADHQVSGWELVERDELLDDLVRCTVEARSGNGRVVLVSGEAGAGKTAVLRRWRELVSGTGEWREGACESLITPRPGAPFLQMAAMSDVEVERAAEEVDSRGALFRAVLDRLAGAGRPVVVAVEDAHWADELSLDLLWHLARRVSELPVVVAVTFRDDEEGTSGHLPHLLGELARLPRTTRVHVPLLSREGIARLVGGSDVDVEHLFQVTGGNPYFVTELVMSAAPATVPPSVRDAIRGRLARLSGHAREGVFLAALVGQTLPSALVDALFPDDADEVVGELVSAGLWVDTEPGPGFRHELTRQVVEDEGPVRRRAEAHRRILAALESTGSREWARLAHHASGARDDAAVVGYARRAGVVAAQVGSMREAAVHFETALEACPPDDLGQEALLVGELAEASALRKDYQRSIALRARERSLWLELGDHERAAEADLKSVWVHNTAYDFAEAVRAGQRALLELAGSQDRTRRARAHAVLARLYMLHDRVDDALAEIGAARQDDPAWVDGDADLLNTEACCRWQQGQEWMPSMRRALDLARPRGDAPTLARALYNTVDLLRCDVRLEEALEAVAEAATHASSHGLTTYHFHLELHRAAILERMGRWDEALELAGRHLRYEGDGEVRAMSAQTVAVISARRGDVPPETGLLDAALTQAESSAQPQNIVPVRLARAEVAWLAGDEQAARAEVEAARARSRGSAHLTRETELWARRCEMATDGDGVTDPVRDEVAGRTEEAARAWQALGAPYDSAWALLGSDREEHLAAALQAFEALGAVVPARLTRRRIRALGLTAPAGPRRSTRAHPAGLTAREQEILACLAEGMRNREIAARLFIGERTVATHVSSLMRKLELPSRTAAAAWFHAQA